MRRALHTALLTAFVLALSGSLTLAEGHDGGEGWWGETDDKVVTNAGYILMVFFVAWVSLMSFIQWRLDKRKGTRMAAEKARRTRADQRGGW